MIDRLEATGIWPEIEERAGYRNEHLALEALLPALTSPKKIGFDFMKRGRVKLPRFAAPIPSVGAFHVRGHKNRG